MKFLVEIPDWVDGTPEEWANTIQSAIAEHFLREYFYETKVSYIEEK